MLSHCSLLSSKKGEGGGYIIASDDLSISYSKAYG
jgi:DNA-binding IscR family transcriptional regulator